MIKQVSALQEEWPELYPFLIAACRQNNAVCIEGLYLMGELAEDCEAVGASGGIDG